MKNKHLSKAIKHLIFNIWGKPNAKNIVSNVKNHFGKINSILLLRQDRIGDVMVSTPFFKTLKENFPNAQIDIILSQKNKISWEFIKEYFHQNYIVDTNIKNLWQIITKIRSQNYDLLIDMLDNPSSNSTLLSGLSNAKQKLGFFKENAGVFDITINNLDKTKFHIVDRILQLLIPLGIDPKTIEKRLYYTINKDKQNQLKHQYNIKNHTIGIVLSGSNESKYWGDEKFSELIEKLNKLNNIQLLIFESPNIKTNINVQKNDNNIFIKPQKTIDNFIHLLSLSKIILTPDTSAVHFASALQINSIVLFSYNGNTNPTMPWFPIGVNYKAIIHPTSIKEIKVDEVYNSILEEINKI